MDPWEQLSNALSDVFTESQRPHRRPGNHLLLTDAQWAMYDAHEALGARMEARGGVMSWTVNPRAERAWGHRRTP